jgi:hypothetical protein
VRKQRARTKPQLEDKKSDRISSILVIPTKTVGCVSEAHAPNPQLKDQKKRSHLIK